MGKGQYRAHGRGQRQRGFDDDNYSMQDARADRQGRSYAAPPRGLQPADGPALDATVKMFNSDKGFGFVALADGSGDAFPHIGIVLAAGRDAPLPRTKLRVQVGQGAKGAQVTAVLEVDASTAAAPRPRSGPRQGRPDPSTAIGIDGT